jgi:tyrosinase
LQSIVSNSREINQKRIVKFIPTEEQRRTKVKEWQEVTPELLALLQRLDDRLAANAFIKKYGKKLQWLPPKNQLAIFPEELRIKDLKVVDRLISKYICLPKKYRVRKNQASLTKTEWLRFKGAINALRISGIEPPTYQEYVDIHVQAMTTPAGHMWGAHGGSNFLPWHREYLTRFENRLRLFNPLVTVPYWDWANDSLPAELADPQDLANWGITRNSPIGPMPSQIQVNNTMAETTWNGFRTSLEGIHNSVHVSVGGQMGTASSPSDPIFWLHHGFIDKIWADWQKLNPTKKPTNLSEVLQPPPIFQRTVGQVMSTLSMGYVYL